VQNKATGEMPKTLFDRRNSVVNKGLSARRVTRVVKPKPTSVVASRAIRLDERPVAMGGAASDHRRPLLLLSRSTGTIEADPATMKAEYRRVTQESGALYG
jgi:hypothetical protein